MSACYAVALWHLNKLSESFPCSLNSACFLTERVGAAQRGNACWSVAPVHFASSHKVLLRFPQHGWKILVGCCKGLDAVLDGAEDLRGAGTFILVNLVDLRKCNFPTQKWNFTNSIHMLSSSAIHWNLAFYLDLISAEQNYLIWVFNLQSLFHIWKFKLLQVSSFVTERTKTVWCFE